MEKMLKKASIRKEIVQQEVESPDGETSAMDSTETTTSSCAMETEIII